LSEEKPERTRWKEVALYRVMWKQQTERVTSNVIWTDPNPRTNGMKDTNTSTNVTEVMCLLLQEGSTSVRDNYDTATPGRCEPVDLPWKYTLPCRSH